MPQRSSIGAKLFGAFIAMSLITGALGGYGLYVLSGAGGIVVDTYDRPLMAINFARSASLTFMQMDKEVLRRKLVPAEERVAIDAKIEQLTDSFAEDLEIAERRSLAEDAHDVIRQIRTVAADWSRARRNDPTGEGERALDAIAEKIIERFDALIELTAGHSFVERRKAMSAIGEFKYTFIAASLLAILLSAGITLLLARRISRPLAAAATVANRIAGGELETPIPRGGADETGTLLRSMTVMQDNLRIMMEREKAQRRSAQSRLIDAVESSREGMVLVDAAGHIVLANSQLARFFPVVAPHVVSGADFAAAFQIVSSQLARSAAADRPSPISFADGKVEFLGPDGEFQLTDGRWIRFSRSTTSDGGFFLFLSDFTEIKEREESFKEAKRQAEAASTAKSAFLANMSHELRTPLNAIIGFSEMIAGQMVGAIEQPEYVDYAGDIVRSGRHLLDVINSVLDLAKSQAGKLQLNGETIDLRGVLDDCVTMLRGQCVRARLALEIDVPDHPLTVYGEPAKLRQIFLNLLSNAVKFTEPGGSVALSAHPTPAGRVAVRIADTGIGMAKEDLPVALAPFGQIDSRLARRYEGTGLGLPLTQALVELHGGVLAIDSERGVGTIVTVTLLRQPGGMLDAAPPALNSMRHSARNSA
jgi:signal transduction histidine kinase/HAMP domain-containing protein